MDKKIATIIKSISHIEYVAQVINPKEQVGLTSSDYKLGSFVLIGAKYVGLIYDTEIFNPNSLTLSSQKEEFEIFIPDYQDEIDILLKILVLGELDNNIANQGLPSRALEAGMEVSQMSPNQIKDFHLSPENKVQVKYHSSLNNFGSKLNPGLFKLISEQLKALLSPEQYKIIEVIERNLLWTVLSN
ncbi:MAG: hypothetical protein QNJ31_08635 [Candidatus Caenarcaniphilales bacterium]|nr:hypothetical protein [Candidatus Caenarcaniphilales bacterium]